MFKNKHVIIALLVTPVLAILTWFAVGSFVGEKAQPAIAGQSYPLVEKSNCRYDSGQCDVHNKKFRLTLTVDNSSSKPNLVLSSSHPLNTVLIAIAAVDAPSQPTAMVADTNDGTQWRMSIGSIPPVGYRIYLAVNANDSSYFTDVATIFLDSYR